MSERAMSLLSHLGSRVQKWPLEVLGLFFLSKPMNSSSLLGETKEWEEAVPSCQVLTKEKKKK